MVTIQGIATIVMISSMKIYLDKTGRMTNTLVDRSNFLTLLVVLWIKVCR